MWGQLPEMYQLQNSASKHMNPLLPRAFVLEPIFLCMVLAMFQSVSKAGILAVPVCGLIV